MKAIIVADGEVSARHMYNPGLLDGAPLVVAADGGALKAEQLGLQPQLVVGDADSLDETDITRLRAAGAEVIVHPRAKDESDTELALREAVRRGATTVVILGALGGLRFDHALANLMLLTLPGLAGLEVLIVDGATTVRAMGVGGQDGMTLAGRVGDLVSLLPLSDAVEGVTTRGLAYPLDEATLRRGPSLGVSNVMGSNEASISTRVGTLAVIQTRLPTEPTSG